MVNLCKILTSCDRLSDNSPYFVVVFCEKGERVPDAELMQPA